MLKMQFPELEQILVVFQRMMELLEEKEQNMEDQPLVITVEKAARLLEVSTPTFREHFLCRPDFPKFAAGTKYLIPYKALVAWINNQQESLR